MFSTLIAHAFQMVIHVCLVLKYVQKLLYMHEPMALFMPLQMLAKATVVSIEHLCR